jgi:hypothetical protein
MVFIVASQTGNVNYAAAADLTNTFEVTKATASVTLTNLSQTYDGTPRVVGAQTTPTNLLVTFTYDGNALAPTNMGSYTVTGTVVDVMYQGSQTGTLVVSRGIAGVYLTNLAQVYNGSARTVSATTMPAGLTVTITYEGSSNAPVNAGRYTVTGLVDEVNWGGSQTGTLVVAKGDQVITNFAYIGDQLVTNKVHLSAQASSGLPVIFAGFGPQTIANSTNLTFTGTGVVTIVAIQWGDDNWNPAALTSQTFMVTANTYIITPTAGAHGSILPSNAVSVVVGESTSFVIQAESGYYIESLTTNNVEVMGVAGLRVYTSGWNNVQANGALAAVFSSNTAVHGVSVPWLRQYFPNAATLAELMALAATNSDSDPMLNWQEYWSNTDPTNGEKYLRITTVQGPSGLSGAVIRWTSESGVVYRLRSSTDNLVSGLFTNLVYTNLPATYPINVSTDETAVGKAKVYYRIDAERLNNE